MIESSKIAQIIDYTAGVAGLIEGVKSTFGTGQGVVADPLRAGQFIAAAGSNPSAAYAHWSDAPGAPPLTWVNQEGTTELSWTIPMRLWLPKSDEEARRMAMPFYDRYLRAFVKERLLGGMVMKSEITRFRIGGDKDWSWLDIGLLAVERINYLVT